MEVAGQMVSGEGRTLFEPAGSDDGALTPMPSWMTTDGDAAGSPAVATSAAEQPVTRRRLRREQREGKGKDRGAPDPPASDPPASDPPASQGGDVVQPAGTALSAASLNDTALSAASLNGSALDATSVNGTALDATSVNGTGLDGYGYGYGYGYPAGSPDGEGWGGAPSEVPVVAEEPAEEAAVPGRLSRAARWLPWAIATPFFLAYGTLSIAKYETLGMASFDLAIFTQIVRSYSELHAPIAEIKAVDYNTLGDHFHPIVALIAPFYAIWKTAITLLVAQALLFALSIVVVSREAFKRLGTFAGVTIGIAYGLGWGLQSAISFEFHEIAFAPLLMALALQAMLNERWKTAMLWAAMLLLVKEDLGLTVAMFGVVMFLRGKRLLGFLTSLIGVAGFVLVLKVLIPMANPSGHYDYTARDDLALSFSTFFEHGQHTKIWMLIWLFAITGFLCLRSNIVLLIVPTLIWRFATSNENYWGTSWQYSAILMPIVFMAMIDAMQKMKGSKRDWVRGWATHNPAVTVVVGLMLLQQFPLNQLIKPETYTIPTRALAARQAASYIPDGAVVESDNGLLPYIVQRTRTLFNGATGGIAPDFVVFDAAWGWAPSPAASVTWAQEQHPQDHYQIVYSADTFTVLRRDGYRPPAGWVQPDWRDMP
jgi:uncharacterized membrane protein